MLISDLKNRSEAFCFLNYDVSEKFLDKIIRMIGNHQSGTAIAMQILKTAKSNAISRRKMESEDHISDDATYVVTWKPEVRRVVDRAIYFQDGSYELYERILAVQATFIDFGFLRMENLQYRYLKNID